MLKLMKVGLLACNIRNKRVVIAEYILSMIFDVPVRNPSDFVYEATNSELPYHMVLLKVILLDLAKEYY